MRAPSSAAHEESLTFTGPMPESGQGVALSKPAGTNDEELSTGACIVRESVLCGTMVSDA